MLGDQRIEMEVFLGQAPDQVQEFTSAARTYENLGNRSAILGLTPENLAPGPWSILLDRRTPQSELGRVRETVPRYP